MTIETDLQALLAPLVGGRVSPDIGTGEGKPYITYQQVGGEAFRYLGPEAVGTKNARMQINVWSDTRNEAAALARQIEDLLVVQLQATPLGAMTAVHEEDTGLYGTRQDYSIWYVS